MVDFGQSKKPEGGGHREDEGDGEGGGGGEGKGGGVGAAAYAFAFLWQVVGAVCLEKGQLCVKVKVVSLFSGGKASGLVCGN